MSTTLHTLMTTFLGPLPGVSVTDVTTDTMGVRVHLTASASSACCPDCQTTTTHIHSRYDRHVADVPWGNHPVHLQVGVRKFFCRQPTCQRRIFTERLPDLAVPWARKTIRLSNALRTIGMALGGAAGARLATCLRMSTSPATIQRLICAVSLPTIPSLHAIGIDEWAWRRGQRYGTIIVNLINHQVIDLLPDRSATTVAAWLRQHPTIKVVCRDRSELYADGIRRGAPQAVQVADRFHLVQNLRAAVELSLVTRRAVLQQAATQTADELARGTTPPPLVTMYRGKRAGHAHWETRRVVAQHQRNAARVAAYEAVHVLRKQQTPIATIARLVGICRETVYTYLQQPMPPGPKQPQFRRATQVLTPYIPYLLRRWEAGCHDSAQLWREIREHGYQASARTVSRFVTQLRRAQEANHPATQYASAFTRPQGPSARAVSFLLVGPEDQRSTAAQTYLTHLRACDPLMAEVDQFTQEFLRMVRERGGAHLADWMHRVQQSGARPLARFADGLQRDWAAIQAGLTLPWHNGATEGQVNRIKLLKRQGYGRAGFTCLRQRVLYTRSNER
ncbi:MAG: ISL3 family transposase [Blastochloris sp.]|nr:ISL3 family transposase [Blastochloris sp.]